MTDKPSLIKVKTIIGYGSPKHAGKESAHGAAIGVEERQIVSEKLSWPHAPFEVPQDAFDHWRGSIDRGAKQEAAYHESIQQYKQKYPKEFEEYERLVNRTLPPGWEDALPTFPEDDKPMATR